MQNLADFILKRRLELGIQEQAELARRAGLTRQSIYQLENATQRDVSLSTVLKLAKALKVPDYEILCAYKGEAPKQDAIPPPKEGVYIPYTVFKTFYELIFETFDASTLPPEFRAKFESDYEKVVKRTQSE